MRQSVPALAKQMPINGVVFLRTAAIIFIVGIFMSLPMNGGGLAFLAAESGRLCAARIWFCCMGRFGRESLRSLRAANHPAAKFAEAVAIANGRILAVGSDAEIQILRRREYQGR